MASILLDQDGRTIRVELTNGPITIGRDPKSDVVLRDDSVSRQHACIFRTDESWQLLDPGSRGGTFVNHKRILRDQPVVLSHRDSIKIGPYTLRFKDDEAHSVNSDMKTFPDFVIADDSQSHIQKSIRTSGYGLVSVRPQEKLNGILKINEALAGHVDVHAICPRLLDTLFEIFPQADRGAILLLHGTENDPRPVAQKHRRPEELQPIRISRTILRNVLTDNAAILYTDIPLDPRVADSESLATQTIQSTMCVPMLGLEGKPFGIISLDSLDPRSQFFSDDLQLILAVASQASHAFENARLLTIYKEKLRQDHELKVSAQVQKDLIPEEMPEAPGYRMFGSYDAAQIVGGDYYDCFEMPDRKICVSFGDVSGHGFPAALIMARLSGIVRNTMNFTTDVALAMNQINSLICKNMTEDRFVTYILGVIDPEAHSFTFANAGHIPPEVRCPDGTLFNPGIENNGLPIGIDLIHQYKSVTLSLPVGSIVVLRTDGVDEAKSATDQQFGERRFRESLLASPPDPESICRSLLADVQAFAGAVPQNDDITILVFARVN